MNRPKIKLHKTWFDWFLELFTIAGILGAIVLLWLYYQELPAKVPIHFNWPSKDAQGLGEKHLLWFSPVICTILSIGISILNRFPWVFNYPVEINAENARLHYAQATQMLRLINLLIGLLCFWVTLLSIYDVQGKTLKGAALLDSLFPIAFFALPILYLIKISIKQRKTG